MTGDIPILIFILIGFVAQLINGSLGMAYGMLSMTFLMVFGVPPLMASSSIHIGKLMTSGVSGFSHWRFGNLNRYLAVRLIIFGMLGGVGGALVATQLPGEVLKPLVALYILVMGLRIIRQSFWRTQTDNSEDKVTAGIGVSPLGVIGGFVDAIGGGGWGPIVTSTLLAQGRSPRHVIGSVSLAESFVAGAVTVALLLGAGHMVWNPTIALGLVIGGVSAAPIAAFLTGYIPVRSLMGAVGTLIVLLSLTMLANSVIVTPDGSPAVVQAMEALVGR